MDPGSFEASEGEDGDRVITPETISRAISALQAAGSAGAKTLGIVGTLLDIPISIVGGIFGLGARANLESIFDQLGVKYDKNDSDDALITLATKEDEEDGNRTLSDKIDMDPSNPKSAVYDLRPQTLRGSDGKSYKADYTTGTRTQEFAPPKPGEKSALQIAQENVAKEQAAQKAKRC